MELKGFINKNAEVYIPDGKSSVDDAVGRITHMAIGAHSDDLEFGAIAGIGECYFSGGTKHFGGITVTNGRGPDRTGPYKETNDDQMEDVRRYEQRQAASIGKYSAQFQLNYASKDIKSPKSGDGFAPKHKELAMEIYNILMSTKEPLELLQVHNPFDKHETHNAVTRATIEAVRMMPPAKRPKKIVGYEIWRALDWLPDAPKKEDIKPGEIYKETHDVSQYAELQAELMKCFDSQIAGGKKYDAATLGRERANATYLSSHTADTATHLCYSVDMTSFINSKETLTDFTQRHIDAFANQLLASSRQHEPKEISPDTKLTDVVLESLKVVNELGANPYPVAGRA